jgi:hypothetical protein
MIFDESWAPRLLEASRGLTQVAYVAGVMPAHQQVLSWVTCMFGRFSEQEIPRVRAWVDGGQRYTITDELVRLAPQRELPLPRRLSLAAGADSYCVTFNGLNAWSSSFEEEMQRGMLQPLFRERRGAPIAGCDFYSFLGNYGFTPFGVHDDADESLLWHLGPGTKSAFVWPRAEYQQLTGGVLATPEYQSLLQHARRFDLSPGDLLFIPMGDFHLFETRDFSATLGLTLFPEDPVLECTEGLRLLAPNASTLQAIGGQSVTLHEIGALRRLALESNGHLISSPSLGALGIATLAPEMITTGVISGMRYTPLRPVELAGREGLLVRRRVLWGRPNGIFKKLSQIINSAERRPFEEVATQLVGVVEPAVLVELIRRLHQMGGLLVESC